MFYITLLGEKTLLSKGLSRLTLGPKLSLFLPFLSVFFSLFLRAHVLYASGPGTLNGPQCLPSPYRVTFDLFGQRDQQGLLGEETPRVRAGENPVRFNRKGTK